MKPLPLAAAVTLALALAANAQFGNVFNKAREKLDEAKQKAKPVSDRAADPGRHVARHQFDLFAASFAERVKERLDGLAIAAGGGPHQPTRVVVDDDGQVLLTFPVRYLIDPDAREAGQQVDPCRASPETRSQMPPTVHQAIRISSETADFDVLTANQATWSSNARVNRES